MGRAGLSPYASAPDDPSLAKVSPRLRGRLSHRDVLGVYPPVAQAAFRWLGGESSSIGLKGAFAAADLAVVVLIASSGAPGSAFGAALYAFHPLPITETAGQGHLDSLGVALLLGSLLYLSRGRSALSGVSLALSILTKYIPLVAILVFLRRGRWKLAVGLALTASAVWIAASRPGASPVGGLGDYAARWSFNAPLYGPAVKLMEVSRAPERAKEAFLALKERLNHPAWTAKIFPFFYSAFFARALLAILLLSVLIAIAIFVADLEAAVFASLAALLLFSPTLHPWYLLWVLPFAAKRREPAFLYLSFAAPLSYGLLYPLSGVSPALLTAAAYAPFALLLGGTLWRAKAEEAAR